MRRKGGKTRLGFARRNNYGVTRPLSDVRFLSGRRRFSARTIIQKAAETTADRPMERIFKQ